MKFYGGKFQQVLLLVLATLLLANCGEDKHTEPEVRQLQSVRDNYELGKCDHSPFDGQEMTTKNFISNLQSSGYFNKPLDLNPYEQSLTASSFSIVKAMQSQGVFLYHVDPQNLSPCFYFDFLFPVTGEAKTQWDNITSNSSGGSTLLGLFTTYYNRNSENSVFITNPTIILRRDTQKWTLIHEMTHYLFALGRTKDKSWKFRSELNESIQAVHSEIQVLKNKLNTSPNANDATTLMNKFKQFFDQNYTLDKRGPLEEFAIESMLLDSADNNQITDVDLEFEMKNAHAYMSSNASLVTPSYRRLIQEIENIDVSSYSNAQTLKNNLLKTINETLNFIYQKMDFAEGFIHAHEFVKSSHSHNGDHHHFDLDAHNDRQKLYFNWD